MILLCTFCLGQQVKVSSGEATTKQESNMTADQARKEVIALAKINAIENAFGSYIEQDIRNEIKDGQTTFDMVGNVKVKGEWVETLQQPKVEFITRMAKNADGEKIPEIWLTCKIKGRIREIVTSLAEFESLPLNRPDKSAVVDRYANGDSFYLFFRSAIEGYLSVYVEFEGNAYRVLPYGNMSAPYLDAVPVAADKEYLFFHANNKCDYFEGYSYYNIEELQLGTEKESEFNTVYTVFSKRPFTKPVLSDEQKTTDFDLVLPKSIEQTTFDKWLRNNSADDRDFQYKKFRVQITNR